MSDVAAEARQSELATAGVFLLTEDSFAPIGKLLERHGGSEALAFGALVFGSSGRA